jgi:hypothetical protein
MRERYLDDEYFVAQYGTAAKDGKWNKFPSIFFIEACRLPSFVLFTLVWESGNLDKLENQYGDVVEMKVIATLLFSIYYHGAFHTIRVFMVLIVNLSQIFFLRRSEFFKVIDKPSSGKYDSSHASYARNYGAL